MNTIRTAELQRLANAKHWYKYAHKEIDVTAYVQSEKTAGRNVLTLGMHNAATSSVYVRANSCNATSNKPELVIVTNAAPTVSISSPANGAAFTAPTNIRLTASAGLPRYPVSVQKFQGIS